MADSARDRGNSRTDIVGARSQDMTPSMPSRALRFGEVDTDASQAIDATRADADSAARLLCSTDETTSEGNTCPRMNASR